MSEIKNIINKVDSLTESQNQFCLATVVNIEGSSYRMPGAKMIISRDGKWTGSVSGGCLEGDMLKKARQVIESHEPTMITYDTNDDSEKKIGLNLGCNGLVDIFAVPLDINSNILSFFREHLMRNGYTAMAVVVKSSNNSLLPVSTSFLFDDNGFKTNHNGNIINSNVIEYKLEEIYRTRKYNAGISTIKIDALELDIFYELFKPEIKLYIFGSGFDTYPVVKFAKLLGWNVTVASENYSITYPEKFEQADNVIYADRDEINNLFSFDEMSYAILMSHNYKYDLGVLKQLIQSDINFIGILGPRKRYDKIKEDLYILGIELSQKMMDRIHSPVGLDIGGDTPEELALSMISEIQSVIHNKDGNALRKKTGLIHEREPRE